MTLLFANAQRMIVAKSRRETYALIVAGLTTAAALSYLHAESMDTLSPADRTWTGQLAAITQSEASQAQALSSAALVVPKSHMVLPPPPEKPIMHVKSSCDSADLTCVVRPVPTPPRRRVASLDDQALLPVQASIATTGSAIDHKEPKDTAEPKPKKGLLSTLNPLNHMPDMSIVGKPFSAASRAVSGWIKIF